MCRLFAIIFAVLGIVGLLTHLYLIDREKRDVFGHQINIDIKVIGIYKINKLGCRFDAGLTN